MRALSTPFQTIGPFFGHALPWEDGPAVADAADPSGIWVRGRLLDGEGAPVTDALIETWQADPDGRFNHPDDPRGAMPGFCGFGRCPTDSDGGYAIRTRKPGRVPGPTGGQQAPHIDVSIFTRGLLQRLVTRLYFADEDAANAQDAVLASLGSDEERRTLLAVPAPDGYRLDIQLQGEHETVFFSL